VNTQKRTSPLSSSLPTRYTPHASGVGKLRQQLSTRFAPWAGAARGMRLHEQAQLLMSRHSSEDVLYALFFILHAYVLELDIVRYTINPTWEKGPIKNAQEFGAMCTKCGDKIGAALTDPETKATIDLLNACDMRDQVRCRRKEKKRGGGVKGGFTREASRGRFHEGGFTREAPRGRLNKGGSTREA
tara:strand:- start:111 stop:671 length:561 start_codon:yes stop_codon:yes gene_type:complete